MDFIPSNNSDYNTVEYWNSRFALEDNYEWCKGYAGFQSLINKHVPKSHNILVVGNGNSNLPIDLYSDSYLSVTSMDYAESSIEKLKLRSPPTIKFVCCDMRFMKFDTKFDTVIEKGTLDVLFTRETSPWSISEDTKTDVHNTLSAIKNCMSNSNNGAQFISITFSEPFFRKKYYADYWTNIQVEQYGDSAFYHFIVCR